MTQKHSDLAKLLGGEELLVVILARSAAELHESTMNEDFDGKQRVPRLNVRWRINVSEEWILRRRPQS